jgi:hypothetical protein
MSGISQIANTMATGQRRDVEKNSTTPRKDHPINVTRPWYATQADAAAEESCWVSRGAVTLLRAGGLLAGSNTTLIVTSRLFGRIKGSPYSIWNARAMRLFSIRLIVSLFVGVTLGEGLQIGWQSCYAATNSCRVPRRVLGLPVDGAWPRPDFETIVNYWSIVSIQESIG